MKTSALFGVTTEVVQALKLMPHVEYLEVGVALMNRVQVKQIDSHTSEEFKYRAKAIENYEKWLKETE